MRRNKAGASARRRTGRCDDVGGKGNEHGLAQLWRAAPRRPHQRLQRSSAWDVLWLRCKSRVSGGVHLDWLPDLVPASHLDGR